MIKLFIALIVTCIVLGILSVAVCLNAKSSIDEYYEIEDKEKEEK